MEPLFLRIVSLSLTTSLVLLPLLLAAGRIQRRYTARTFYFVWLLLAVRLLLPLSLPAAEHTVTLEVPSTPAVVRRAPAASAPVQSRPLPVQTAPATLPAAADPAPAEPRSLSAAGLLGGVWLAGMAAFLLWQGTAYGLARRALLARSGPADGAALAALREEGALRRSLRLRSVPGLASPMVLGLIRPVLFLPAEGLAGEPLAMVLRHELIHLRRWDVAYKGLLLLANAVHWFNPLVWWMAREGGRNLELCCDDDVVRGGDAAFRRRYGEILIRTAAGEGGAPALSTRFCGGKAQVKRRLKNLFQKKKNSAAVVCLILAAAVLAGSLVACEQAGASGRISEDEAIDRLEESITYDGETGELRFTIPEAETPSQPWQLQMAGRAEFEDGMGMSLHYHTDTEWEPGQSYTENLSEVADHLTELNLDVTLGITERTIDLLPYLSRVQSGFYQARTGSSDTQAELSMMPCMELSISDRRFSLAGTPQDPNPVEGSFQIKDGSLTAVSDDGTYRFVFAIEDSRTLLLLPDQSSPIPVSNGGPVRALGDTIRFHLSARQTGGWSLQSGSYRMDLTDSGIELSLSMEPHLYLDTEKQRFTLAGSAADSYLSHGTYTMADGVITATTDDGQYWYCFEIEDRETLILLPEPKSRMFPWVGSYALKDVETMRFRFVPECIYENTAYGFSIQLPAQWAADLDIVEESGGSLVTFYQRTARRADNPALGVIMNLCVAEGADFDALYGDKDLSALSEPRIIVLGRTAEDQVIYLHIDPSDDRSNNLSYLRREAAAITPEDLAFREQPGPVYQSGTYSFRIEFPASWAEPGTQEWARDIRVTEVSPEEVQFSFAGFEAPNGAIAALYVSKEPMDTTARLRLLGSWESDWNGTYYVYLSFEQTGWPEYASWPERVQREMEAQIARYETLYTDLEALPPSRFDSLAGRTAPEYGEPLWPVAEWTAVTPVSERPAGAGAGHSGIDIAAPAGTEVLSAWNGAVTAAGFDQILGNCVWVDTGADLSFGYCHLASIAVEPGQQVARGTMLGTVGRTGQATGSCLHLEMRAAAASGPVRVDPMDFFAEPAQ